MTTDSFEKAVRLECLKAAAREVRTNPYAMTDEGAVRYGPFDVARAAGVSVRRPGGR